MTKRCSKYDHSDIRNAGLGLIHLLYFVHSMNWPCRLNDDGWKSEALEKADGYEIAIEGTPGIERLLADIREKLHNEQSDEDKNEQSTDKDDLDDITNCTLCCKSRSRGVVITLKSLKLGLSVRKHCKWVLEVRYQPESLMWCFCH